MGRDKPGMWLCSFARCSAPGIFLIFTFLLKYFLKKFVLQNLDASHLDGFLKWLFQRALRDLNVKFLFVFKPFPLVLIA